MEQKSIKGTRTEHNLLASFAGESQARSRYTLFAKKAEEEGYQQIAAVFRETAEQELQHARQFFSLLEGGMVEITAAYPAGVVGDTAKNLAEAAAGEREEWGVLYENFAKTAEWMCRNCGFTITAKAAPKRCPVCGVDQGWFERRPNNY